jgi:dissimilatory sulfite reductase (desulfoviridin) alpha/beta subunit
MTSNNDNAIGGDMTQLGAELLYRFASDKLFVGGRYNRVSGKTSKTANSITVDRINAGAGWFMTENILTKVEYVTSNYSGNSFAGTVNQGASFNGIMIEAVIGF